MLVSPELLKSDFGRRMIMIDEPIDFSLYGCWIFQCIKLNFGTQESMGDSMHKRNSQLLPPSKGAPRNIECDEKIVQNYRVFYMK